MRRARASRISPFVERSCASSSSTSTRRPRPARAAWKAFFRVVVAGFDAQNIHANFSVRRGNKLSDFIYLPDSAFVAPESLKNFDRIDMVFVGGEPSRPPVVAQDSAGVDTSAHVLSHE